MIELLETYSLSQVIVFFIIFCLAIKETVTFYDWAKTRIQQCYNKNLKEKNDKDKIQNEISDITEFFEEKEKRFNEKKEDMNTSFIKINERIDFLTEQINMLIESDKDDIKSYITEKHHSFCYERQWIDDYSLDCLEKRFKHYEDEGGNSFVESLMEEIRSLPKHPPT